MQNPSFFMLLGKSIEDTFYQYVDNSKVNGMWLLRRHQNSRYHGKYRRYIWSIVLFSLLTLGVFLSIMLWNKFYSLPTIVTVAAHVPITNIGFPGITLCSPLAVLEHKLEAFLKKINIGSQYTYEDVVKSMRSLEAFTVRQTINETRYEILEKILHKNNLTVYETIKQIGGSCEDFLLNCFWNSNRFPCYQANSDLSFKTSVSHLGFCCSFNYNPENQSYIPFSTNNFGVSSGLVIVGLDRVMGNESTGLILKVHHPLDYAVESNTMISLNPCCETFVVVYPVELSSSFEVLELSTIKRNCQIPSDFKMSYYRQAGCILNCQQQLIYRTCDCHPYHYPRIYKKQGVRYCSAKDIICFLRNFDSFKNVQCHECLPNCYDVAYSTSSDYTDLLQHRMSASAIYNSNDLGEHNFIVRIYLANHVVQSHKKIIIMSAVSLLADIGGVFNLCLGISVISVFEFIYFFTFRLYANYKSQSAIIYVKEARHFHK